MIVLVMLRPSTVSTTRKSFPNYRNCYHLIISGFTRWICWQYSENLDSLFISNIQYYASQVNLNNPCPFWTDHSQCGLKYCAVKPCTPVSFAKFIQMILSWGILFVTCRLKRLLSVQGEVPEGLKSSSYKVLESHIMYIAHIGVVGCWLFFPTVFRRS